MRNQIAKFELYKALLVCFIGERHSYVPYRLMLIAYEKQNSCWLNQREIEYKLKYKLNKEWLLVIRVESVKESECKVGEQSLSALITDHHVHCLMCIEHIREVTGPGQST